MVVQQAPKLEPSFEKSLRSSYAPVPVSKPIIIEKLVVNFNKDKPITNTPIGSET